MNNLKNQNKTKTNQTKHQLIYRSTDIIDESATISLEAMDSARHRISTVF